MNLSGSVVLEKYIVSAPESIKDIYKIFILPSAKHIRDSIYSEAIDSGVKKETIIDPYKEYILHSEQ
jgi:hypothetical protein